MIELERRHGSLHASAARLGPLPGAVGRRAAARAPPPGGARRRRARPRSSPRALDGPAGRRARGRARAGGSGRRGPRRVDRRGRARRARASPDARRDRRRRSPGVSRPPRAPIAATGEVDRARDAGRASWSRWPRRGRNGPRRSCCWPRGRGRVHRARDPAPPRGARGAGRAGGALRQRCTRSSRLQRPLPRGDGAGRGACARRRRARRGGRRRPRSVPRRLPGSRSSASTAGKEGRLRLAEQACRARGAVRRGAACRRPTSPSRTFWSGRASSSGRGSCSRACTRVVGAGRAERRLRALVPLGRGASAGPVSNSRTSTRRKSRELARSSTRVPARGRRRACFPRR